jgi:hypothetical protein
MFENYKGTNRGHISYLENQKLSQIKLTAEEKETLKEIIEVINIDLHNEVCKHRCWWCRLLNKFKGDQ